MFLRSNSKARNLIFLLTAIILISMMQHDVSAQTASDLLMEDVNVHAVLTSTGRSYVTFSANVTNRGVSDVDSFDIRVDLRDLEIESATVEGANASTSIVPQSNFALLRIAPETALISQASHQVEIKYTTDILQESVGICDVRNLCLENALFYVRPLNEFADFTFKITLPPHAVLDAESSPLFPQPTANFTDGASMLFVWETGQILPGQEQVYIIKYGLQNIQPAVIDSSMNTLLLVILAGFSGAAIIVVAQKLPSLIRAARVPRAITDHGMTEHEQQVIQILSRKGGSCSQRDVYDELGMSQSLASMVLTGLEQRGVIRRFREGRENIVHLVEE